jgi:hypothetical protein
MDQLNFMLYPYVQREDYYFPGNLAQNPMLFQTNEAYIDDTYIGDKLGYNITTDSGDFTSLGDIIMPLNYNYNYDQIASDNTDQDSLLIRKGMRVFNMLYDTIRIYISTGYMLNSLSGFNVRVYAKCAKAMNFDDGTWIKTNKKLYLLNYYMPKEYLKNSYKYTDYKGDEVTTNVVKMLPTPLYMNSRFYDRYVEIKVPAAE